MTDAAGDSNKEQADGRRAAPTPKLSDRLTALKALVMRARASSDGAERDRLLGEAKDAAAAAAKDADAYLAEGQLAGNAADVIKLAARLGQLGDAKGARDLSVETRAALINAARDILRMDGRRPAAVLAVAKALANLDEFNLAWRILDRARRHPEFGSDKKRTQIVQRRALYTYKDVTQPLGARLGEALHFLRQHAELPAPEAVQGADGTKDQETLGLAGAIYKRKWELEKREEDLRLSRDYYMRGYRQGWGDQGYTAINAAYVLDLLAYLGAGDVAKQRGEARTIREEIVANVPDLPIKDPTNQGFLVDEWFYYSTVGEAYFGLGDFEESRRWLVLRPHAEAVTPPGWEFETTARQLANVVRVQSPGADFRDTGGWKAFQEFLDETTGQVGDVSAEAVARSFEGKIGLALSGGGFRASLYHIGVLARLAELDVLRRVEVISCVSGGSIVGAHYYLEVQRVLQEKTDEEIDRQTYVEIVRRVQDQFLKGVQTNIRTSVLTDSRLVRRMVGQDYSRTRRLGELYEERLYTRVGLDDGAEPAGAPPAPRYMHELVITPLRRDRGKWLDFKPRNHNWRREAKAPILILNAAVLNTGHNWQFTATYMGEAPATIHREVDSVYRLRRKYYTEEPGSPESPQAVRLGDAVAASSCVPVLFEPLALDGMYEAPGNKPFSVKLVDGGVCDNQGVAGLLEQDCTVLLVSDGSGQMEPAEWPSSEALGVALRSNDVLQARVRGTQYRELDARLRAGALGGMMFVHLKQDLDNTPVNWKGCPPESRYDRPDERTVLTRYKISKDVQRRLATIRTDLDSFSEVESYALMLSGYNMTEFEFDEKRGLAGTWEESAEVSRADWKFLDEKLKKAMKEPGAGQDHLNRLLDASGGLFLKTWKLDEKLGRLAKRLKALAAAAGVFAALAAVAALVALTMALFSWASGGAGYVPASALMWVGAAMTVALLGVLALGFIALLYYLLRLRAAPLWADAAAHAAMGGLLYVVGSPLARVHMRKYEAPYLELGRLEKLP